MKLTVAPASPADGKALGALQLETETGMFALAVNRGGRWTCRPETPLACAAGIRCSRPAPLRVSSHSPSSSVRSWRNPSSEEQPSEVSSRGLLLFGAPLGLLGGFLYWQLLTRSAGLPPDLRRF